MKIIRLFIASSIELFDFRNKIDTWVAHKNRILDERGFTVRIEVDKWEFESAAIPQGGRSQDEYYKLINRADVVTVVVKNKIGLFTQKEFYYAVKLFEEVGKPRISVFALPSELDKQKEDEKVILNDFLNSLRNEKENREYFHAKVDNEDALWIKINNELDRSIDAKMCLHFANYPHPIAIPIQLEDHIRKSYHATTLSKEDKNGQVIETEIKADDFCSQVLLEAVNKNSVIITGEGASGKSTLLARFFEFAKEKAKIFYIPINELDYGLDKQRRVSISDFLFREYFRKPYCETSSDVFNFISDLDDAIFILDGYNELEYYHTAKGGRIARNKQLDNDIMTLRNVCQKHVIITSRNDVFDIRSYFELYRLQRVSDEDVREFLIKREEQMTKKKYLLSEGERNDLIENLKTPILLNIFDEWLRSNDLLIEGVSLGMFERPTNKGQIFYNYLCNEMFKSKDNHQFDAIDYAVRGLIFFKYVVPFMARKWREGNRTYITSEDIRNELKMFLKDFNKRYVESGVFDDLNEIAKGYCDSDLLAMVALDIEDDGSKALAVLIHNYHILKTERSLDGGRTQRYSFEHPVLGEVLATIDIWNQMALQNEDPNFKVCDSIMSKSLPFEEKELLADFCASKYD